MLTYGCSAGSLVDPKAPSTLLHQNGGIQTSLSSPSHCTPSPTQLTDVHVQMSELFLFLVVQAPCYIQTGSAVGGRTVWAPLCFFPSWRRAHAARVVQQRLKRRIPVSLTATAPFLSHCAISLWNKLYCHKPGLKLALAWENESRKVIKYFFRLLKKPYLRRWTWRKSMIGNSFLSTTCIYNVTDEEWLGLI